MRTCVWTQGIVESILKGVLRNQKCLISAPAPFFFFLSNKTAMYSTVQVKLIHIINQVKCGERCSIQNGLEKSSTVLDYVQLSDIKNQITALAPQKSYLPKIILASLAPAPQHRLKRCTKLKTFFQLYHYVCTLNITIKN